MEICFHGNLGQEKSPSVLNQTILLLTMGDPSSSISQEPEGGIVDQVLSATQLIFRDPIASKRGGTIFLSYVSAPHLATSSTDKPDEPYAWETR